jgi:hypothetical protein
MIAGAVRDQFGRAQPQCTFSEVIKAIDEQPYFSVGIRQNLRSAVVKMANLVSPAGLLGPVSIEEIADALDQLTPVRI